mmetsp:Transcript_21694/g.65014  ORF Transcript_21694/g.65014 Transcript_21694/m.65014 type:complete len:220 (-) Transcript_21694:52-711(-)
MASKGARGAPRKLKPKTASMTTSYASTSPSSSRTGAPMSSHCATRFWNRGFAGRFGYTTSTLSTPKCRRCRAATRPSPPLLPGPATTSAAFASGNASCTAQATLRPASSMSWSMEKPGTVIRSTSNAMAASCPSRLTAGRADAMPRAVTAPTARSERRSMRGRARAPFLGRGALRVGALRVRPRHGREQQSCWLSCCDAAAAPGFRAIKSWAQGSEKAA